MDIWNVNKIIIRKNRVHYVLDTGPVEIWKNEDDDFSICSRNQFAEYTL